MVDINKRWQILIFKSLINPSGKIPHIRSVRAEYEFVALFFVSFVVKSCQNSGEPVQIFIRDITVRYFFQ